MKYVLVPFGSHGDIHPFVGLGKGLAQRGHRVVVLANNAYQSMIENERLEFVEHSTAEEFQEAISQPDVWHPVNGFRRVMDFAVEGIERIYQLVADHHEPGETIVVHSPLAFGVRVAQDKLRFPAATVHLAPVGLRSYIDPPVMPMMNPPRFTPKWILRGFAWMVDRWSLDRLIGKPLNDFRATLDLPPAKRIFNKWWNSPDCILAMFPEWFSRRPADWPSQVRLTGFPLYDEAELTPLADEVRQFLDAGDAPLVFTPGTANTQAKSFFQEALKACEQLNRRAMFLTRFREHLPNPLPDSIRHFEFVPFSQVFSKSAVVVHHGGIGTLSQCLSAGVPQLIMPMGFDQPDNAARVQRLGVGASLTPKRFTAMNLVEKLTFLLAEEVQSRCRRIADQMHEDDGIANACDVLESLQRDGVT